MTTALIALFTRDLNKLKAEIAAYPTEADLWRCPSGIANSGGNLCLHLIGNLNTYIGRELGGTGYVRQREQEFALKNVRRSELYAAIDETIERVTTGLQSVTTEQLRGDFPTKIWRDATAMDYTLVHLHGHLTYHLGQINYHRRLCCS